MSKINKANMLKTIYYLKKNGVKNTLFAAMERMQPKEWDDYVYVEPSKEALLVQSLVKWENPVVFSIVVPTYKTKAEYFHALVESVLAQSYPYFELILADASGDDSVAKLTFSYEDERIKYVKLTSNAGIADNTNEGIKEAKGDYVALLDHDDLLTPDALYHMAMEAKNGKVMIYSDEDKCDGDGKIFYEPHFKKDFDLDLFLSNNYICHFTAIRTDVIKELMLRKEYDGAQDFDLFLRVVDYLKGDYDKIAHVPKILYHWRCHMGSTAANPESKRYAYDAGLWSAADFALKQGWEVSWTHSKHLGFYEVIYEPNLFANRKDVAAVGGRILNKKKCIVSGAMDKDGNVLYQGLRDGFSGYVNRGSLNQQVPVLDIRCISVREEYQEIFEEIVGLPYKEKQIGDFTMFDATVLPKDCNYIEISKKLSEALREKGVLLWNPKMVSKNIWEK